MITFSLQAEHRTLDDILANSHDCPLAVSFDETFHTLKLIFPWKLWFLSVSLIDGMVPIIHAFLDDDGHLTSVNGVCHLSLLPNTVRPKLWYAATCSCLGWMKGGFSTHCTNAILVFFNEKFRWWVLSRRTANSWPAHNLIDFYFWAAAQNQVFQGKT